MHDTCKSNDDLKILVSEKNALTKGDCGATEGLTSRGRESTPKEISISLGNGRGREPFAKTVVREE